MNSRNQLRLGAAKRAILRLTAAALVVPAAAIVAASPASAKVTSPSTHATSAHATVIVTHAIAVNTANWTPFACCSTRSPGWYTDNSGIIHLQGAARQIDTTGKANLLGTLPKAARPSRSLYFLVHTFAGTFADLAVNPNGTIVLIDPRSPAVKDYFFVSLEGITYKRGGKVNGIAVNTTNWTPFPCCGARSPGWYADKSGIIHLQGAARQISATGKATLLGTLPKAARPSRNLYFVVHTWSGTYADVAVNINGAIVLIGTRPPFIDEFFFVSLEGITYKRGGKINGIGVNTTNWTPFPCCGARSPGWYADKSGIIHLQGAARQIGTTGKANLLGTLPKAARPSRNLYFIVHTWSGTYADLAVNANGTIVLIGARSPEITDYTFVSLEGITYKRK